jgi:hypothetical protein
MTAFFKSVFQKPCAKYTVRPEPVEGRISMGFDKLSPNGVKEFKIRDSNFTSLRRRAEKR